MRVVLPRPKVCMEMADALRPVIAIIGATGTGKSKLAVELAERYNGEIINADAMQMYAGLPVVTNKIPQHERSGIKHHLLGHIPTSEQVWRVDHFVPAATAVIDVIHRNGKLPVIVGGSHYYIQKLLFQQSLTPSGAEASLFESTDTSPDMAAKLQEREGSWPILDGPTEAMLEKLREVDPIIAQRWHPNERRKIRRSLQIWLQTGRRASDLYLEQAQNLATTGSGLRWPTLILWTHAPMDTLNQRLEDRVEGMLAAGLVDEVFQLEQDKKNYEANGMMVDETAGIWVSIGYKEFKGYCAASKAGATPLELSKIKAEAQERTVISTRQYAKKQLTWIRIKLLNALRRANAQKQIFVIDTSTPDLWDQEILKPAAAYVGSFLRGEELPDPAAESELAAVSLRAPQEYDLSTRRDLWQVKTCEACGITAATEKSWNEHVRSKKHKSRLKKQPPSDVGPCLRNTEHSDRPARAREPDEVPGRDKGA